MPRSIDDVYVFHAGTALKDGRCVTNGGRVLGVTALGDSVQEAISTAYEAVAVHQLEGCAVPQGYRQEGAWTENKTS